MELISVVIRVHFLKQKWDNWDGWDYWDKNQAEYEKDNIISNHVLRRNFAIVRG